VQYSGLEGKDVVVPEIPGLHWECKRVEVLQIHKAIAQATEDAATGEVPVVASRRSRGEWLLTLRLDDALRFAELFRKIAPNG